MSCGHSWNLADFAEAGSLGLGVCALQYAAMGYRVFPVERGGKKPHPRLLPESGGVHHATRDPGQIRSWWSLDMAAGIGVATGHASALCVIDLDVKKGNDGKVSLGEYLRSEGLQLPWPAPAAHTPNGGMHVWLRAGTGAPSRKGILPGVDVKADGGHVVAPPSALLVMPDDHDGERVEPVPVNYYWVTGCPCSLPEMPGWLYGWLASAPDRGADGEIVISDPVNITELTEHGAETGERNDTLMKAACSLFRRYGTSQDAAAVVLGKVQAIWEAGDRAGFPWREVLTTVESARKFIERQQRGDEQALAAWKNRG